jgi:hypothetical protein
MLGARSVAVNQDAIRVVTLGLPSVLARRIIAVSPDPAFGQQVSGALQSSGGNVEVYPTLLSLGIGELQAALCVLHLEGELAAAAMQILARLGGACRAIIVLPRANLASIVDLMRESERVAGMMISEDFQARELTAMASRILTGDMFGVDKIVPPGTQIQTHRISNHEDKAECMARIASFCEHAGVPRQHHAAIEQCVDEMVMNALYDAPVDEQGGQVFAGISARARVSLRITQTVVVQYAYDGRQFAVSVRDAYGSLARSTVLRVLYKCLHAEEKIDRRASGAGVGLYLMVTSASRVFFEVVPGVATEAACTFDVRSPKLQLGELGFFLQPSDVTGKLQPARRLPAGLIRRQRRMAIASRIALGSAALVALFLIGSALWSRLFPKTEIRVTTVPSGATIELEGRSVGTTADTLAVGEVTVGRIYSVVARLDGYQPRHAVVQVHPGPNPLELQLQQISGTVELDSKPSGAAIEIDGKPAGDAPLSSTSLPADKDVTVVFKRRGYRDATAHVHVPAAGGKAHLVQPLDASDELVRVHFESKPSGARVMALDLPPDALNPGHIYTPADVFVEVGKEQHFQLTMPGHEPLVIPPFTAERGSAPLDKGGELRTR